MIAASGMYMPWWFEMLLAMIMNWPVTLAAILTLIAAVFTFLAWRKARVHHKGVL